MAAQHGTVIHQCRCEECKRSPAGETAKLHGSINRVVVSLDERRRRHFAGLLASQHGYGGIQQIARVTGMSRTTILRGRRELAAGDLGVNSRVRAPGGGRTWSEKNTRTY
jgi:hypothetical protein